MNCKKCGTKVSFLKQVVGYCEDCHLDQIAIHTGGAPREVRQIEIAEREEQQRTIQAQAAGMIVTTETAHNLPVTERLGIVAGETVLGVSVFKDMMADLRGAVGGNSQTMQTAMKDARQQAMEDLKAEAVALGADAVVGVSIEYNDIGGSGKMMVVAATGTAVKLAGKNGGGSEMRLIASTIAAALIGTSAIADVSEKDVRIWKDYIRWSQQACEKGDKDQAADYLKKVAKEANTPEAVSLIEDELVELNECHQGAGAILRVVEIKKNNRTFKTELALRIKDACYDVAKSDPLRAYTDQTFVEIFKVHGLP